MHAAAHLQRSHHALVAPKRQTYGMTSGKLLIAASYATCCSRLLYHAADSSICSPKPGMRAAVDMDASSHHLTRLSSAFLVSVRGPCSRSRAVTPVTAYLPPAAPPASADVAQAFKRLQNGSDVRGVALAGERQLSCIRACSMQQRLSRKQSRTAELQRMLACSQWDV